MIYDSIVLQNSSCLNNQQDCSICAGLTQPAARYVSIPLCGLLPSFRFKTDKRCIGGVFACLHLRVNWRMAASSKDRVGTQRPWPLRASPVTPRTRRAQPLPDSKDSQNCSLSAVKTTNKRIQKTVATGWEVSLWVSASVLLAEAHLCSFF